MNSYDEVLYQGYCFAQTHPDRLATLATLFGMQPAPVERCRVLELGCGDGSNLMPMALALPASEFVGIDLAARPIGLGQELAGELALANLTLRQMDVLDVSESFGQFDYVIAHGLYSWIPPAVRDHVLAVCRDNLAPQGVAFVSYNVHPGGHLRLMLREMMLFHIRHLEEPRQRINQARAFLNFLLDSQTGDDAYRTLLRKEAERVAEYPEEHFYHDDLAGINEPVYFHQFVEEAAAHDLQYLSEADYFEMQDSSFPEQTSHALEQLSDNLILKEQYADFIKCRRFRQTLLCRREVELERNIRPERLARFYVASPARPVAVAPDTKSSAVEKFRGATGVTFQTDHPLAKTAILHLGERWPRAVHFTELLAATRAHLGQARSAAGATSAKDDEEASMLLEILLRLYAANLVELHAHAPQFVPVAGERPVASPLARLQARRSPVVTSLRHTSVRIEDALGRHILLRLDGTRDRAALLAELRAEVETGTLRPERDGLVVTDARSVDEVLSRQIEENLSSLAQHALLVA